MKIKKILSGVCLVLAAILFVNGLYMLNTAGKRDSEENNRNLTNNMSISPKLRGESSISQEMPVNILVLGLDEYGERSDVIVLLNYNPDSSGLNILSVTRDTRVFDNGKSIKINSLISLGGEEKTIDKIEEITGLPIDYYMTINFEGFRKIIDTLGGVRINIPFDMNYDDPTQNLHIHLKKGPQLLNGAEAEEFVRFRKGNKRGQGYPEGDIGRIKAQQEFIKALIEQKLKLKYISKADEIFFILSDNMKTNIKIDDIRYYLKSIKNIKRENINAYTIAGRAEYIDGQSYFINDEKATKKLIDENFYR